MNQIFECNPFPSYNNMTFVTDPSLKGSNALDVFRRLDRRTRKYR